MPTTPRRSGSARAAARKRERQVEIKGDPAFFKRINYPAVAAGFLAALVVYVGVVYLSQAALLADLDPFEALVRLSGAVMVSHAIYPGYDDETRPDAQQPGAGTFAALRELRRVTGQLDSGAEKGGSEGIVGDDEYGLSTHDVVIRARGRRAG